MNAVPSIVILDGDPAAGSSLAPESARGELDFSQLESLGTLTVYQNTPPELVVTRAKNATIVLTNKVVLDRATLEQLPQLRMIGVLATGTNVIDVAAATELGVVVSNVPGYSTASTAQLTIALLLELCHHAGEHSRDVHSGTWTGARIFAYWKHPLLELDGLTLGIVGFGAIGQRVAHIAQSLGMRLLVHTRTARELPENARAVDKATLLAESDVVTLHCPLTPATQHFIDDQALAALRPGALLVNVSRGPIVDSWAVRRALDSGRLGGFAADVLEVEPPPVDHPLLHAPRCVLTPHIAWATEASRRRLLATTHDNVEKFLQGTPQNVVGG
ncbi:MAG TPA: D-2-hydroxyacid dehydrogenase [Polyangiaceae bacterium]|nr:D-2-hydroxyacid dehydrogenase [Polyangiaceae bacterium]